LIFIMEARNCDGWESEPREAISAREQSSAMCVRSLARTNIHNLLICGKKELPQRSAERIHYLLHR
jgi:hypothetical protein